ncbi:MAG: hypothetical protein B6242_12595 [Anaerolineaceae bacterium 4572_78]|nr:MAG: hypothetical protein B6242_12595 [Anaerolineaceae bacterium 4572_78]
MSRLNFFSLLFSLFVLIFIVGCASTPNAPTTVVEEEPPGATIDSPTDGDYFLVGEVINIRSTSKHRRGIVQVELLISGQSVRTDRNPDPKPNTPYIVGQAWTPVKIGTYTVQMKIINTANIVGKSDIIRIHVVEKLPVSVTPTSPVDVIRENTPTLVPVGNIASTTSAVVVPTFTPPNIVQPSPTTVIVQTLTPPNVVQHSPTVTDVPTYITATPTQVNEPTPAPLPTHPNFPDTGVQPDPLFEGILIELEDDAQRLGHPLVRAIAEREFAQQYFETGVMFWWDNPESANDIWVMYSSDETLKQGATWGRYDDTWDGQNLHACQEALVNGEKGPVRGFGKVWCLEEGVRLAVGNPRDTERGSGGNPPYSVIQYFQGGIILYNPINSQVFVLFNNGDWRMLIR